MESLLYTFNLQCKFMLPCKYPLNKMLTLDYFSNLRGFSEGVVSSKLDITDADFKEIDQNGLQVLLRYFSMPSTIDLDMLGGKASEPPTKLTLGILIFWQNALFDLRDNFITYSIKPITLPVQLTGHVNENVPYEATELELAIHA